MPGDLEIRVDANVNPAVTQTDRLSKSIDDLSKGAANASDRFRGLGAAAEATKKNFANFSGSTIRLNELLHSLSRENQTAASSITKSGAALSSLKPGANQAAFALQNLGRVAQDAPFGFIGIQNNINPLLESFQRLKTETGTTGGAFKALASSLVGAGGLGLAISVATGLLTIFSISGLGKTNKALDENEKAAKKAAEAYNSIVESVSKEVSQVEILVNALKNETLSRKQRVNAIEELQRISPGYFSILDKEKASIEDISKAYDAYSLSIIRTIELKIREAQLDKVIQRRLELQDKGTKLTEQQVQSSGKLQKVQNAIYDEDAKGRNKQFRDLLLTQGEQKELNQLLLTEKDLLSQIGKLGGGRIDVVPKVTKPKKGKLEKDIKEILNDETQRSKGGLDVLVPINFGFATAERAADIGKEITGKISKGIAEGFEGGGVDDDTKAAQEALRKRLEGFNDAITDTAREIGVNFFIAIGEGLATGSFDSFFSSVFKSIGAGLKQLGIYFITASKLIQSIKATLTKIPALALLSGIALVALGSLIEASAPKGFATGVRNFQGDGNIVKVGEHGAELIRLPNGSDVIPNGQMNALQASELQVTGRIVANGQDLVVVIDRARKTISRNS